VKVLITGAGGQLGTALIEAAPNGCELHAVTHRDLDIADTAAVESLCERLTPTLVMNAAAFTNVDAAEALPEAAARANAVGPAVLARTCRRSGAWLVHVSTDYVFGGRSTRPCSPTSLPQPLNVYGTTKLEGERAVAITNAAASTIVRTSWLYAPHGQNFLSRMLELMTKRDEISVVSDQIGAPTAAEGLAQVLWEMGTRRIAGLFHWCDSGVASRYDFAVAIAEEALAIGLLRSMPRIVPVGSGDYPAAARRPHSSLLDTRSTEAALQMRARNWRTQLRATLAALQAKARQEAPA